MHPIKGYGPSLSDQGYGPEDAPIVSGVTNCTGCQIDYDPETGAATISYCADHDGEELDQVIADAQALSAEVRRLRAALLAARPHVAGSIAYPEHTRDEVLAQLDAALGEPGAGAPDLRCENAGCGSGAWLTDDDECPVCGWRAVTR